MKSTFTGAAAGVSRAGRDTAGAALDTTVGLIRRNPLFAALLGGGAVLRLVTMLGYPPILWFTGDSYFYTIYAERMRPSPSKTLGYPFLLRLLEPLHSLVLVSALQHLMGLAMAVLVYVLLLRFRLPRWGAALATVPVLYDAYQIELEHLLMSEALFTFLILTVVTIVLWRAGPRPVLVMAVAGLLLGWAVLARSAGVGAIPVLLGCLALRRAGWRAVAAATVGCALPLAGYALWFHSRAGTYGLTNADGLYLWGRTASFADCGKINPPPNERVLCLTTPVRHRPAPGTIIWRNVPPRHLPGGPVTAANNALLRSFSLHAIEAQPLDYLSTVAKSTVRAFLPYRSGYPNPRTEALYHFPAKPHVFPKTAVGNTAPLAAARAYGHQNPARVINPYARVLRGYQTYIALPGPLLAVIFAVGAAGLLRRRGLRPDARWAVPAAWGTAVVMLLFPIAMADFDYRYVLPVVPFACIAAALALAPRDPATPAPPAGPAPAE